MPIFSRLLRKKQESETPRSKLVYYLPVVGLAIITLVLYFPDIYSLLFHAEIQNVPVITFQDKINIVLTLAIAAFAAVEAYSTYTQVVLEEKRIRVEDAWNELEKAYGPLYALLNRPVGTKNKVVELDYDEKEDLDNIMATYPFMFPSKINDLWKQKVQKIKPTLGSSTFGSPAEVYEMPLDFRNMVVEEYDKRVKEYNKILKK